MTIDTDTPQPRAALSLEALAYLLLFALALALRLANLAAHPLNDVEASEALTAWRFSQGLGGTTLPDSPAYLTLTALGLLTFGDHDFVARLAPALFGAALVLLPALARGALGGWRALLTAALLAVSSIGIMASRSADGATLAVFFVWLAATALWRDLQGRPGRWGIVAAAAFGAALASGPQALLGLIALAVALAAVTEGWPTVLARILDRGRSFGLAALAAFLIAGTFFLLNRDGLGAAAAGWVTFIGRFTQGLDGRSLTALVVLLGAYDPLIVVAGAVLAALTFARGGVDRFLTVAVLVVAVLSAIAVGRSQFDLLWVIVLLTPHAAQALLRLATEYDWRRRWALPVSLALILLAVVAFVGLNLSTFVGFARLNVDFLTTATAIDWRVSPWSSLGLAGAGIVMLPLITVLIGLGWSYRAAVVGLLSALALLLGATMLTAGWGQAHLRPGSPVELWWPRPVGADLARLRETVFWAGEQTVGEGTEIEAIVQASPDGAVAWALRGFSKTRFVAALGPEIATAAVIAPMTAVDGAAPTLGAAYVGASYELDPVWFPDNLFWFEQLDWLLYRRAPVQFPTLTVLWLRSDIQAPEPVRP